jgi:NAD(P)-dependent dehydrogenase (short-subunit alcohol dehydrogenase family)
MTATAKPFESAGALVTGGTSGIGLAVAAALIAAGVKALVVNGRSEERGLAAVQHLRSLSPSATVEFVAADVTSPAGASLVRDRAVSSLASLDILVNCAGGDHAPELFLDIEALEIQTIFDHYTLGAMQMAHCVLPLMMAARSGVIINVASDAGRVPTPGACLNGAAMAALIMFSRTLALEAKRSGIRVHAVTPSIVKNTRTFDRVTASGFSARLFGKAMSRASLGVVSPEDVAATIIFLASPAASRMTGQVISVNGGISIPT